jgi:hypothetical protein
MDLSWRITQELYGFPHAAGPELDRLALGPVGATLLAMESALADAYITTEARVHVITGRLRASGHPSSTFDGEEWTGEIDFARYPGIYELARGPMYTRHHGGPGDSHYFFDPGGPDFERAVRQAVWDFVTDGDGGAAPAGDLGPYSGG